MAGKYETVYARQLNIVGLKRIQKVKGGPALVVMDVEKWDTKEHFAVFDGKTIRAVLTYFLDGGDSPSLVMLPSKQDPTKKVLFLSKFQGPRTPASVATQ